MHYDGLTAVTPLHGNILDADGKYRAKATEQAVAEEVGVVMCAPQFGRCAMTTAPPAQKIDRNVRNIASTEMW